MAFMIPFYAFDCAYSCETNEGTEIVPFNLVGNSPSTEDLQLFCNGKIKEHKYLPEGVVCRLSAPGYSDCTEWTYFKTLQEAKDYIKSTYDVDPDTGESLDDDTF